MLQLQTHSQHLRLLGVVITIDETDGMSEIDEIDEILATEEIVERDEIDASDEVVV